MNVYKIKIKLKNLQKREWDSGRIVPFTKEERKLSILANVYIAHGIVVVHQTIDWQRKKTDLVCVLRYDRIKPGS